MIVSQNMNQGPAPTAVTRAINRTAVKPQISLAMRMQAAPLAVAHNMAKASGPVVISVNMHVLYDPEQKVFVMEDGTTPFVDETGQNKFKPE